MGDLILSYPVIQAFAEAFPGSPVLYVAPPGLADIAYAHPAVREVRTLGNGAGSALRLSSVLRSRKIEIACALWTTSRVAWLLRFSNVPVRIGQEGRALYSFLFTHRVRVRSARGDVESHWVECLLDYPRALGLKPKNTRIAIEPSREGVEKAEQILRELGIAQNEPLAAIHCGKGENVQERGWPLDLFAKAADELNRAGFRVLFTGSKSEIPLVESVLSRMFLKGSSVAGKTDFQTLAALLKFSRVLICPDSGPMHLAAAVGTPVTAIFAMKKDFPERWAPWGVESKIIRPDKFPCRPWCTKENCPDFLCYKRLSPRPIVEAALDLVEKTKGRAPSR